MNLAIRRVDMDAAKVALEKAGFIYLRGRTFRFGGKSDRTACLLAIWPRLMVFCGSRQGLSYCVVVPETLDIISGDPRHYVMVPIKNPDSRRRGEYPCVHSSDDRRVCF